MSSFGFSLKLRGHGHTVILEVDTKKECRGREAEARVPEAERGQMMALAFAAEREGNLKMSGRKSFISG